MQRWNAINPPMQNVPAARAASGAMLHSPRSPPADPIVPVGAILGFAIAHYRGINPLTKQVVDRDILPPG